METKISPEEGLVGSRKSKKVRFSPKTDNQVFEFTRSAKKNDRTLRCRCQDGAAAKASQQGGSIELRRLKRSVSQGITVAGY